MYAKLAWRNIRRSLRDYSIYFMTLVFAVAIFYVFNSMADQPAMLAMRESTRRLAEGTVEALSWLIVIMTGVVALLVLYANRVIVKKRSRELGTYLLLGMEQGRLAVLLLSEIATIGMAALLVGLAAGILLSQAFALVVSRVFAAGLTNHTFVFSGTAATRTLLCYGLTFLFVGIWQAAALYRQKLIDLINGVRKNEAILLRNRAAVQTSGVLSLAIIGVVYWLADQVSRDPYIDPRDGRIWLGTALAVGATYLLFFAAGGLLTGAKGRMSGWMGRGLNRFVYRQVTSKINTHTSMLATIALMLTFTICAMSFGLGLGEGFKQQLEKEMPFDYEISSSSPQEDYQQILDLFDQYGVTDREEVQLIRFETDLTNRDLMLPNDAAWFEGDGDVMYMTDTYLHVISASAYQQLRRIKGYTTVEQPPNSFLIHAAASGAEPEHSRAQQAYQRFLESGARLELGGRSLYPGARKVYTEPLVSLMSSTAATLVVPDDVAEALEVRDSRLLVQLAEPAPEELDHAVMAAVEEVSSAAEDGWMWAEIRAEAMATVYGLEAMLVFITFYMGVMFILISATLLSLQQVTDAVEHRQRFTVLRKLGADERMIDGVIARQLALYFLTPVAVALMHSLAAMIALARLFRLISGYTTVWPATLVTLGIFGLIYGAYYLLSLQSCRRLFRERQLEPA